MSDEKVPWYRRPLPAGLPGWLILCLGTSAALAYVGYMGWHTESEPYSGVREAAVAAVVGFCFGIVLLNVTQTRQLRRQARGAQPLPAAMLPPTWLSGPVMTLTAVLLGYSLADGPRQVTAVLFVLGSLVIGIRMVLLEPRVRSIFASGIVCLLISTVGIIATAIRLWAHQD